METDTLYEASGNSSLALNCYYLNKQKTVKNFI